jgi:hypothetical protein
MKADLWRSVSGSLLAVTNETAVAILKLVYDWVYSFPLAASPQVSSLPPACGTCRGCQAMLFFSKNPSGEPTYRYRQGFYEEFSIW